MAFKQYEHFEIEEKRQEMMNLASALGYTSPDTIRASQELDNLMNTLVLNTHSLALSLKK
jgi:hypothetical protein